MSTGDETNPYTSREPPQWLRDSMRGVFGPWTNQSIDDDAPWSRDDEWALVKRTIEHFDAWIQFASATPTAREFMALRKSVDEFRHARPADVRDRVSSEGRLFLGTLTRYELQNLESKCEDNDVYLYVENASEDRYEIYNRTQDYLWRIKDRSRYDIVISEMLEFGVPIFDATASG